MRTWNEIKDVLDCCTYPGFEFELHIQEFEGRPDGITTAYMQVRCREGVDTDTGAPADWKGRKWQMSRFMTDTEVVQTAWAAVQRAILHEASEIFKFDGQAIYDRHLSVYKLHEIARAEDGRDGRPDGMVG